MQFFEISFFDGLTAASHPGFLFLEGNKWRIKYMDSKGFSQNVEWDVERLHKNNLVHGKLLMRYGDFPNQSFECADPNLIEAIRKNYAHLNLLDKSTNILNKLGTKGIVIATGLFIVFVFTCYFFIIPPLAYSLSNLLPVSFEEHLRDMAYPQLITEYKEDDKLSQKLQNFADKIDFQTPYKLELKGINFEMVNAFALPAGRIVVFSGILKKMDSPEQLAALLAHEAAHVNHRHAMRSLCKNLSSYIFLSLIFNDVNGVSAVLVENAHMLNTLSYSRSLEEEADHEGIKTLKNNQISVDGMVQLFKTLKEETPNLSIPQFMSTHPLTDARIENAQKAANQKFNVSPELNDAWMSIKTYVDTLKL